MYYRPVFEVIGCDDERMVSGASKSPSALAGRAHSTSWARHRPNLDAREGDARAVMSSCNLLAASRLGSVVTASSVKLGDFIGGERESSAGELPVLI